jgi:hypothetical protein
MPSEEVEDLERALADVRRLRRDAAAKDDMDENDLADLADLQRDLEAIERAIEDERKQEAAGRSAEPDDQDTGSNDHDED